MLMLVGNIWPHAMSSDSSLRGTEPAAGNKENGPLSMSLPFIKVLTTAKFMQTPQDVYDFSREPGNPLLS